MLRKLKRIFLILLLIAVLAAGVGFWLFKSNPSYWAVIDGNDPAVVLRAGNLQRIVAGKVTSYNEENWTLDLEEKHVNEWLASEFFKRFIGSQVDNLEDQIRAPMIHITSKQVELAAIVPELGKTQVVRLIFQPEMVDFTLTLERSKSKEYHEKVVELKLVGIVAGRLPLPLDTILSRAKEQWGDEGADRVKQIKRLRLTHQLDDGRQVIVSKMRLNDGKMILSGKTINPLPAD